MSISGTPTNGDDLITVTPPGNDRVDGLAGDDQLTIDWSTLTNDIVYLGGWHNREFTDDFFATVGFWNFESVTFKGGSGSDDLRTTDGNDQLYGNAGDDVLYSGLGADVVDGGAGLDRWAVDYSSLTAAISVVLPTGLGSYTVGGSGAQVTGIEALSITTGNNDDVINTAAYAADDDIRTNGGDDTVSVGAGFDYADGGTGTDLLRLNWNAATESIVYTYDSGSLRRFQAGTDDPTDTMEARNFERYDLTGGSAGDDLRGGNLNDRLIGNAGGDILYGYQGIDIINGGGGVDRWYGDFTNIIQNVTVNINVAANANAVVKFGTAASGASIKNMESLDIDTGNGNDLITSKKGFYRDVVETRGGDDKVITWRGKDYADGGDGTDILVMNWGGAGAISVESQEWWRTIYTSTSGDRMEARYFERFNLTGAGGADDLRGGSGADTLTGNNGDDLLYSGSGADKVNGGGGAADLWNADQSANINAILFSAAASQTAAQGTGAGLNIRKVEKLELTGGSGDDNLSTAGYALNDSIRGNSGNDIINPGRGFDYVSGDLDSAVTAGLDRLVLDWSDATGNIVYTNEEWWRRIFQDDNGALVSTRSVEARNFEQWYLTGGAGDDDLRGGDSNDRLIGNAGDDTLDGRAGLDTIDGGAGTDLWKGDLGANVNPLIFSADDSQTTAQGTGAGISVRNIEAVNLVGGANDDDISTAGYANDDRIWGHTGDDVINPGRGHDYVSGDLDSAVSAGTDTLVLDWSDTTTGIVVTNEEWWRRNMQAGPDSTDPTHSIEARNIEQWDLTGGSGRDDLRGGDANDRLVGNGGNDVLDGRGGVDTIVGGNGVDIFRGNYSGVVSDIKLNLTAAGNGTVVGVGTTLNSIERIDLTTGAGDDTISNKNVTRNDKISTGGGDDSVNVGRGHHDRADGGTGGTDTLIADMAAATSGIRWTNAGPYGSRYTDATGSYTLDYRNFEVYNLQGSAHNDKIWGGDAADSISGGDGSDMLVGSGGDDQLFGGAGPDQFRFDRWWTNGRDTIGDAEAGDFLRISGIDLTGGAVTSGDGGLIGQGAVQVETNMVGGHAVTTVHVGCNSTAGADLHIDLQDVTMGPGAFQLVGQDIKIIAGSSTTPTPGNDLFTGTAGNDTLDGGAGNDILNGLAGDDSLIGGTGLDQLDGGPGRDILEGGAQKDIFIFSALADSPRGVDRDVIADFSSAQNDKIDVSAIDANLVLGGDQAFAPVDPANLGAAFTGSAGQMRFDAATHNAQFDQDGDGVADMEIEVVGVASMSVGDFVF